MEDHAHAIYRLHQELYFHERWNLGERLVVKNLQISTFKLSFLWQLALWLVWLLFGLYTISCETLYLFQHKTYKRLIILFFRHTCKFYLPIYYTTFCA